MTQKSLIGVFFQFYNKEDTVELEEIFRKLVKQKKFPPFYKMIIMVDHNKTPKDNLLITTPFIITPEDLKP